MSGTEGQNPPPDGRAGDEPGHGGDSPPPYPGWSAQQPGENGWGAPGESAWQPPSTASAAADGATNGWQPAADPSWGIPDAKPGVIPLRPLAVGEILDGAVTTIRRNPAAMLGLSAIVALLLQVLAVVSSWLIFRDLSSLEQISSAADPARLDRDEALGIVSDSIGALAITGLASVLGAVFLTGVLTIVVGRAVLGEQLTPGQAWARARGRLLRMLGLTVLYFFMVAGGFVIAAGLGIVVGLATGEPAAGVAVAVLGIIVAIPVAAWIYVRYSLAGPSLMLETSGSGDQTRPVRVVEALRRSSALVRGSWWRVFGILLLVFIIVWIIGQVISVPFSIPTLLGGGQVDDVSLGSLIVAALGAIIAATITAPFQAAATALLYVDRRIRREGLDIELARAAGVELPGRPDAGRTDSGGPAPDA